MTSTLERVESLVAPAPWGYERAFCRNLGLVSPPEQERLRRARVAIAGMGGVGGVHLVTLLRQGIGGFRIADFDTFDVPNTNRQYGATSETTGRSKVTVMTEVAEAINPEVEIVPFTEGVTAANVDAFVAGASVVLDGLDFFAIDARRRLFARARAHGVTAITAAPLGFGATVQVFSPTGMTFDEYYDLHDGMTEKDQLVAFAVGLAPRGLHLPYMDLSRVNVETGAAPSSSIGCQLASALASTAALQVILGWPVAAAPAYVQFDARRQKIARGRLSFGNRHPLQRLKRWFLARKLAGLGRTAKGGQS